MSERPPTAEDLLELVAELVAERLGVSMPLAPGAPAGPALLTVPDVLARYRRRDPRFARRLMYEAGGFKRGGRVVVPREALEAFERAQGEQAREAAREGELAPPSPPRRASAVPPSGWWRE